MLTFDLARVISLVFLLAMVTIYMLSRDKASPYAEEIGEYAFKLPWLAGVGLYITEKLPWAFNTEYDGRVRAKVVKLYGHFRAQSFLKIHQAQRIALIAAVAIVVGLISLLGYTEITFYLLGVVLAALVIFWADREIDKRINKNKRDILIALPEMINTLALLVNAGLPLSAAVSKIVREKGAQGPLYKEMGTLIHEINGGKPVIQAYEDLARRCRMPEITRFIAVLLQNVNRGSTDLVHTLRVLAYEAWDKRKDIARKQGEEASAKLVLPMVMVFVAVSIIVLAPAVIAMS